MRILSIESSCDETGAAIVEKSSDSITVLSNILATSSDLHAATGGIIPENAAREQVKAIIPVIVQALLKSKDYSPSEFREDFIKANEILKEEIDGIAVTYGPGLIGSLLIGVETAKTLSFALNKPIIPVNHLLAHIYANFIDKKSGEIEFPFIGLIVSGGHTDLLFFKSHNKFEWLGGTRDDAAGEAIDKTGRLLNLSYPAGPEMEKRAKKITKTNLKFKSPLINSDDFDFSFSGLKAEVMRYVKEKNLSEDEKNEVCYAVQNAIIEVLVKKTLKAASEYNCNTILIGGGVSANQTLMDRFRQNSQLKIFSPEIQYATDNAAMIGAYALLNGEEKKWNEVESNPELYFA